MKPLATTITHALAAIGLAGAAVSPALAQQPGTSITVRTADLDLGTAQGQKTLDQRIEKAVRGVCRTASIQTGSRIMSHEAQASLTKARSDARQQVATLIQTEQRGG